ncbi:MAG: TQO small subunit DoxD [Flavobacteriales bacterium]
MNDSRMEAASPTSSRTFNSAGLFTLALRLVVGWTYFSAFWRRVALENKLDPEAAGYIGEKFNHFLPNALLIKPLIEYLVSNPEALWWNMVAFTIIEGVVGLFLMFGLFTRAVSVAVFGLAMGILLGAGWIGTTCLDEWQIGILGLAAGFTMFLTGSATYSVDGWMMKKDLGITRKPWFLWLGSGPIDAFNNRLKPLVLVGALSILFITLATNQIFHGGVWGTLHNKSVRPLVEIQNATLTSDRLAFTLQRVEGADVYGSFLIGLSVLDATGNTVMELDGAALAQFPKEHIHNAYVSKVKPGKHSLILPLGAKAELHVMDQAFAELAVGEYRLLLTDISGATWEAVLQR